jgi:hypothetical protein
MVVHSKLLRVPEFPKLPGTDAADVYENIDNWLAKGMQDKLSTFCRPDPKGHKGYRFVTDKDLESDITVDQLILGMKFRATFHRKVKRSDRSFCPLYFSVNHNRSYVTIHFPDRDFEFKSDNNLKIHIRCYKRLGFGCDEEAIRVLTQRSQRKQPVNA